MRYLLLIAFALLAACSRAAKENLIITSSRPAYLIIHEIVGERIPIKNLLSPAASPHTFSPGPSEIKAVSKANIVFYIAENLDGWAADLHAGHAVEMMNFLPDAMIIRSDNHNHNHDHDHDHGGSDPHFWLNPLAVKAILPDLCKELSGIYPEYKVDFERNSKKFAAELLALDSAVKRNLSAKSGKSVFTFHPSFNYFLKQYGLTFGGSIEAFPGKEPSPNYISELTSRINSAGAKVIFSELQFSKDVAQTIAELTNTKIAVLDPLGSAKEVASYHDLILYNSLILLENL